MQVCFHYLDAPIVALGTANLPAVPLYMALEQMMLPNAEDVSQAIKNLLAY